MTFYGNEFTVWSFEDIAHKPFANQMDMWTGPKMHPKQDEWWRLMNSWKVVCDLGKYVQVTHLSTHSPKPDLSFNIYRATMNNCNIHLS